MFLKPKNSKFLKSYNRGRTSMKKCQPEFSLNNGNLCLISNENSFLIFQQVASILKFFKRRFKRQVKVWTFFSPNVSITRKPCEVRMGKGKGSIKAWAYPVKKNEPIFEFLCLKSSVNLKDTLVVAKLKLPFKSNLLFKC